MANKTFIPAFQASVGDWNYYVAVMKYAQVASQIRFAHELGGNRDLNTLIQRGISNRTEAITDYLLSSDHRFLGALTVATWGGAPEFLTLQMDDPDGYLSGVDQGFGVLTLDGGQSFFAIDGQHRLKAIQDALKRDPNLGSEDICVLLVAHFETEEGQERTQRLFTNINRNAKTTTQAENIALDVDDGFAVTLRAMLTKHALLKQQGVVKVFTKPPNSEGQFSLAAGSIAKTDKHAWTTITVLYDVLKEIGFGLDSAMLNETERPSDEVLAESELILGERIDEMLDSFGNLRKRLTSEPAPGIRAPKGNESLGHPFMRPVVQKAVVRSLRAVIDQGLLTWEEGLDRLSQLSWQLGVAPWTAVFSPESGKMLAAKDNSELLGLLLVAHIAPTKRVDIERARKRYREVKNQNYPVSADDLAEGLLKAP